MAKHAIKSNIQVLFIKEGDSFVCYAPAFDLAAHGDTLEDAKRSFEVTFKLFVEEVTRMRTWPKVLKEYGWKTIHKKLIPPQFIGRTSRSVQIPAFA